MRRWVVITVTIILLFAILFGGTALLENLKPKAPQSGFYKNGLYLEYILQWAHYSPRGHVEGRGILILHVMNNKIYINVTLPSFYPSGNVLHREVTLNISKDNVTYKGEKVILPFFYDGGQIVSYYHGNSVNVTSQTDTLVTLQGGIINFQAVYYLHTEEYIIYPNGTLWNKGGSATYEYGKNTNLLFFINSPIGWDPIIDFLLNITYPEEMTDGSIFYVPVNFGLSLHKTNLDLGPINYFGVVLTFVVLAMPVFLFIGIPLVVIGVYRIMKRRGGMKK